ncbi:ROK family protein [Corynebacterium sp. 3HC-13]|uniref:ROK family protein n=1 Tax=Corynebacterium poyangense TaxID=2684405 RepID=UPI001CCD526D|nr:ROK family protein [Corynebacterium poyangense]MBZ8177411.1 ROK family protein [Corynebacterium poyangense]
MHAVSSRFRGPDPGSIFTRPHTPAARCLHLLRLNPHLLRKDFSEQLHLSQPTITRTLMKLIDTGFVQEVDMAPGPRRQGRPAIPVEMTSKNYFLVGVAIGTSRSYFSLYNLRGGVLAEFTKSIPIATLPAATVIEQLLSGIQHLSELASGRLLAAPKIVGVGITTSGVVSHEGTVVAPNLGWNKFHLTSHLGQKLSVPITVTAAVPAILAAELQSTPPSNHSTPTAVFFADDSLGAAISHADDVTLLPHISELSLRHHSQHPDDPHDVAYLSNLACQIIEESGATTMVLAGSQFTETPHIAHHVAAAVRRQIDHPPQFRLIPSHQEIVRAVARAVASDQLLRDPYQLAIEN